METKKLSISCPVCGQPIIIYNNRYACKDWKQCGITIWKNALERYGYPEINPVDAEALLSLKAIPFSLISSKGASYTALVRFNKNNNRIEYLYRVDDK